MNGHFSGHRGSRDSEWIWDETPHHAPRGRGGPSRRALLAATLAASLIIAGITSILLLGGGGGSSVPSQATPTPSPSHQETATPAPNPTNRPASTPTPRATPSATPRPAVSPPPSLAPTPEPPAPSLSIAAWSPLSKSWVQKALPGQPPGYYKEGAAIPFVLRIDGAGPGATLDIEIMYDCASGGAAVFDFLVDTPSDIRAEAALAGPGRKNPDTAITIPGDPGIAFDDAHDRMFRLWGGSFAGIPQDSSTSTSCPGARKTKRWTVSVVAKQDTLFLMWAGHLATATDWGTDKGASSGQQDARMAVRAAGGRWQAVNVPVAAISP